MECDDTWHECSVEDLEYFEGYICEKEGVYDCSGCTKTFCAKHTKERLKSMGGKEDGLYCKGCRQADKELTKLSLDPISLVEFSQLFMLLGYALCPMSCPSTWT